MCNSPVGVQFGPQFFLIAVYFNSFSVKTNSIDEISFLEGLITLVPVNISCGCKGKIKIIVVNARSPPPPSKEKPHAVNYGRLFSLESSTNQTQLLLWLTFRRKCNPYFEQSECNQEN